MHSIAGDSFSIRDLDGANVGQISGVGDHGPFFIPDNGGFGDLVRVIEWTGNLTDLDVTFSIKEIEGHHLVAAADDERPTLTADGVHFDGVNDRLEWATHPLAGSTEAMAITRAKWDTKPDGHGGALLTRFGSNSAQGDDRHPYGPTLIVYDSFGATTRPAFQTVTEASILDWFSIEQQHDGSELEVYWNEVASGSPLTASISSSFRVRSSACNLMVSANDFLPSSTPLP